MSKSIVTQKPKKNLRKPKPIPIYYKGSNLKLVPCDVGIKETRKVRDQLNKALAYMTQEKKAKRSFKP